MMKVGDKVRVVNAESIPLSFFGKVGEITGLFGSKVMVLFEPRTEIMGSLSHTVYPSDLEIVEEQAEGQQPTE